MTLWPAVLSYLGVSQKWVGRWVAIALMIAGLGESGWAANKPEWIELRSPNFIVVTNANEGLARRVAYQFEMIRSVFQYDFRRKPGDTELPVTILAAKDERTMKSLLPEFWERRGLAHPAGIYLGGTDSNFIAIRADVSLNSNTDEPYEPVYHEYVHYLTRKMIARMPLWLVEGLAEFYGNTRVEGKTVLVGRYSLTNLQILQQNSLLPVQTLFAINASSPYYHEQDKTSIFYAESWALTHYLFIRDYEEHTQRVSTFLALLQQGEDPDAAAAKTIGNPASLDEPLRKYVRNTKFRMSPASVPNVDETTFQVRPMSDAEGLAVCADLMAHDRHYTEAQQMLEQALQADPKLGAAYETLAFVALQQSKVADAAKWSTKAVELNATGYRANYYYAWSLLREGTPDEAEAAKAEASLRIVIKSNPQFVPAYDALAYVLDLEGGKEKADEAHMMALQAVEMEPGNVFYRIRTMEVLEQQQRPDDAVRVATLAVSMAKTAQEREAASAALASAQRFKESSEQMRAAHQNGSVGEQGSVESGEAPRPTLVPRMNRQINVTAGLLLLSDPQGVDFNSYLNRDVMSKIQQAWAAQIQKVSAPAAVKKGTVVVEFAIAKDGSISRLKLQQSTNEDELDEAAGSALQAASPFPPLPANFRGKEILLRFQCNYNAPNPDPGASGPGK